MEKMRCTVIRDHEEDYVLVANVPGAKRGYLMELAADPMESEQAERLISDPTTIWSDLIDEETAYWMSDVLSEGIYSSRLRIDCCLKMLNAWLNSECEYEKVEGWYCDTYKGHEVDVDDSMPYWDEASQRWYYTMTVVKSGTEYRLYCNADGIEITVPDVNPDLT